MYLEIRKEMNGKILPGMYLHNNNYENLRRSFMRAFLQRICIVVLLFTIFSIPVFAVSHVYNFSRLSGGTVGDLDYLTSLGGGDLQPATGSQALGYVGGVFYAYTYDAECTTPTSLPTNILSVNASGCWVGGAVGPLNLTNPLVAGSLTTSDLCVKNAATNTIDCNVSPTYYQTALTNPVTGTGTQYFMPYWTGAGTLGVLASIGNAGYVLTSNGAGYPPSWQAATGEGGGNMTYPPAGVPISTGASWDSSLGGTGFLKFSGTTPSFDNSTYLTSLSGAVLVDQTSAQTIGTTGNRLAKIWVTDVTVTNTITGNTATATKATNLIGGNGTTLLGGIPYQSGTDTTTLLAPNTTTTKKFLTQTGDGTNGAIPLWGGIASGDLPGTIAANTSGTASNVSGAPALPNGTTATTQTQADNSTKLSTTAYVDAAVAAITATSGCFTSYYTGLANGSYCGRTCWTKQNGIVTLLLPDCYGTSNATTFTVSSLPAAIRPASPKYFQVWLTNNFVAAWGVVIISGDLITFGKVYPTAGGFTASGLKTNQPGQVVVYDLLYNS